MTKRKCPLCGCEWYSSVSQEAWNCQKCGYLLTPDLNEEAESAADAMIIAGKNPENEGFYVWGIRKGDSE